MPSDAAAAADEHDDDDDDDDNNDDDDDDGADFSLRLPRRSDSLLACGDDGDARAPFGDFERVFPVNARTRCVCVCVPSCVR